MFDTGTIVAATQAIHDQSSTDAALSLSNLLLAESTAATSEVAQLSSSATPPPNVEALSNETNTLVFIAGLIPFVWATIEFWRRIAVGASFGTGKDSVIISIGEDDNPASSRGRQVLGRGALVVAYVLFGVAAFSIGIAVFSVLTAPPMDVPTGQ